MSGEIGTVYEEVRRAKKEIAARDLVIGGRTRVRCTMVDRDFVKTVLERILAAYEREMFEVADRHGAQLFQILEVCGRGKPDGLRAEEFVAAGTNGTDRTNGTNGTPGTGGTHGTDGRRGMDNLNHGLLPWKVRDEIGDYIIEDANGKPVANPSGVDKEVRLANARFVADAANSHYRLQNLLDLTFTFVAGYTFVLEELLKNLKDADPRKKYYIAHQANLGRLLMGEIEKECGEGGAL